MRTMKTLALAAFAASALALAGCGGGGSSAGTQPPSTGGGGGGGGGGGSNNAANEAKALAAAQSAAKDAAGAAATDAIDARKKATDARAAATKLDELAPNTGSATEADEAATAAETAATVAETAATAAATANTAAQAAKTSSVAKGHQADAEAAQSNAEGARVQAETEYQTALSALNAVEGPMIADARQDAKDAADAAKAAYEAAKQSAMDARAKATAARAAANQAMAARTGYAEADKQATDAETAADNAEAARDAAKTASDNAAAASTAADAATTAKAARAQADTAEIEQGKAETQEGTAATEYDTANTAAGKATTASGTHVMSLFKAASGAHVKDDETTTTVDEKAAHVKSVGAAMAAIAKASNGNQAAGTTASASWPGDTVENPATDDKEFDEGKFSLTVNAGNTTGNLPFRLAAVPDDPDTTDTDESAPQTAMEIASLGAFKGYEIWEAADETAGTIEGGRVIVFTNKQKGKDSVLAQTAATARSVVGHPIPTGDAGQLAKVTSTATTITGVEWTPSGDTVPLKGTLSCETGCSITLSSTEEGKVTAITGYEFTGSRAAREQVDAADATQNDDYLAFGLWLDESNDGATDTFGSFATGGTGYAVNVVNQVTGTAEYSGKAAGAHHKTGEGVNWFDGDASLTANFGTATAAGTISGMVSNIRVNGGAAMSTPIYLGQANLANNSAVFNGAAFMGAATAPGASTHEFDGTWSGSFFGATADDTDTADVNESHVAPKAAAGTFGVTKSVTTGTGANAVTTVESYVGAFGAHKQ